MTIETSTENADAEKAATENVEPEETTTPAPTSETGDKSAQARIDGLSAENKRKTTRIESLEKELADLREAHKSEDEKRLDELVKARVDSEFGEQLQRLEFYDAELTKRLDGLLEQIPQEHRGMVDSDANVLKRVQQAEGVLALLNIDQTEPPVDTGGNPADEGDSSTYTEKQFRDWQALASGTKEDREQYREMRPKMVAAYKSGRIRLPNGKTLGAK